VLEQRCAFIHRFFLTWAKAGRPYVILKSAVSLDGRIATRDGHSQWISGEQSRRQAMGLRSLVDAVMVGAGTVRADDPRLTCRLKRGRHPLRVVADSRLSMPPGAAKLSQPGRTIIACLADSPEDKARALLARGAELLPLPADESGRVSLRHLLLALARRDITSLMAEGGGELAFSLLRLVLLDELNLFMAPRIIGGRQAPAFVGGEGFSRLTEARQFTLPRARRLGNDLLLTAFRQEK
jgi:diaminohydroxyphosphoribosylaminopyrimidine deaminase/5-amino-6-(5-phosphoribosylamino)uracil reductase